MEQRILALFAYGLVVFHLGPFFSIWYPSSLKCVQLGSQERLINKFDKLPVLVELIHKMKEINPIYNPLVPC